MVSHCAIPFEHFHNRGDLPQVGDRRLLVRYGFACGAVVAHEGAQQLRVLAASFVDWSKRVSVLRHTLPKLKPLPIYTGSADNAAVHVRLEMATRHLSINRLNAESNHTFEFTPLWV
mgnify:FL=1